MKTLEEIREIFSNDRFAVENGAVIEEIGDHTSKCSLRLDSRHRNAMGGVMGGVYFTLADYAFAVASNLEKMSVVSISSSISFLSAAKGDVLTAEAKCIKDGRKICFYTVDIYDDKGIHAAQVSVTGTHVC